MDLNAPEPETKAETPVKTPTLLDMNELDRDLGKKTKGSRIKLKSKAESKVETPKAETPKAETKAETPKAETKPETKPKTRTKKTKPIAQGEAPGTKFG